MTDNEQYFFYIFLSLAAFAIYFAPAIVSDIRHHKNRNAIYALTLLLGWTVLGWIAALVWACTDNTLESEGHKREPI